MEVANSSPLNGLTRNSRAPASMDRLRCSASPWTLIMMIGLCGSRWEMISAAAMPSMPGMLMSMTMTSGRMSIATWIASSPELAVPATSISRSSPRRRDRWSRVSGMSSTMRTLIMLGISRRTVGGVTPPTASPPRLAARRCRGCGHRTRPTSWSNVMPIVVSTASSSAWRMTAVSSPISARSRCANLMTSASWSVPAKTMITLSISRPAPAARRARRPRRRRSVSDGSGCDRAGAADVEHPLVLQDGLDRSLILEAGDDLEARRRCLGPGSRQSLPSPGGRPPGRRTEMSM